jgi:hypothetical protein
MPDTVMSEAPVSAPLPASRSPEIEKLAIALAKAQGMMEAAKRSAENPGFKREGKNSTYADLSSVWDAIREPLASNGLSVVQLPTTLQNGVEIETMLLHESGQYIRNILWMPCGQTMTVHTIGSAITYGRRYSLMAVTGVAPEEDDGNSAAGVDGHKPGLPGSAGGGTQFRPERRAAVPRNFVEASRQDGTLDETRKKGELPGKATNGKITPDERETKLKAATDKRVKALKDGPWTAESLKEFWDQEADWREWMADPANDALGHYERFTTAYTEAQDAL